MENTPELTVPQILEELEHCYAEFVERLEKSRAANSGEVMGFFFRVQGNPKVSLAVEDFNSALTGRVAALTELLAQCPAEQAGEWAAQALEVMLFYPVPANRSTAFSLAAFEGHALPLVPFLTPAGRQEAARRCAKRTPPRRMLPNQKKLWQALARP